MVDAQKSLYAVILNKSLKSYFSDSVHSVKHIPRRLKFSSLYFLVTDFQITANKNMTFVIRMSNETNKKQQHFNTFLMWA